MPKMNGRLARKKARIHIALRNFADESMPQLMEMIERECAGGKFGNARERKEYAVALREMFNLPNYPDDEY